MIEPAFVLLALQFALASFLIELTPGPNMAYLAALALSSGRRSALMAVAGVALGLAIVGMLAALGLATLIDTVPWLAAALRYCGIAYLLWLAWDSWREPVDAGGSDAFTSFRRGLITNLLNPKAAAFYLTVMPNFIPLHAQDVFAHTLVLVAIYVGVATGVHTIIVLAADTLRPYLVAGRAERTVRRVMALGLVAIAIWFALGTRG